MSPEDRGYAGREPAQRLLVLAALAALAAAAPSCSKRGDGGTAAAAGFEKLLLDRGLTYKAPPGYEPADVEASPRWRHERALRSNAFKLEVRYGAAPAELTEALGKACGDDARCRAAPSGKALESILDAAARPLAKGGEAKRRKAFPLDAVRMEFRAHWGGVVAFDAAPELAPHKEGIAVVIYREGRGAAMFAAFYDAHSDALEEEWMRAFDSLTFAEPFPTLESEAAAAPLVGTMWRCDNGFVQARFLPSTWTVIHVSAAMAAMGQSAPFSTSYYEIKYLPDSRFSARVFRVDTMEAGDRTPKQPEEERFSYRRDGDKLVIDLGESKTWECELTRKR